MDDADRPGRRCEEKLDILFVTSDLFPPFRPAAKAIFAEGLAARGHRIDWLLQAAEPAMPSGVRRFEGGTAYVAPTNSGETRLARLRRHLAHVRNDFRVFGLLKRNRYSLVQIKDKYLGALLAIAAAKLHGVPVFYWLAFPHGEASLYAARSGVARYRWIYRLRGVLQRFLLYRVIMPACTHVFVQSEQMRRDVAREGIPLEAMTAVPACRQSRVRRGPRRTRASDRLVDASGRAVEPERGATLQRRHGVRGAHERRHDPALEAQTPFRERA